jgi:CheY-like chemotaxis protein
MGTIQAGGERAARFRALLRDRIAEIEGTWRDWYAAPEQLDTLHQLRALVHRLAGSATANHIEEIGRPAQALDVLLSGWQEEETALRSPPAVLVVQAGPLVASLLAAMVHTATHFTARPDEAQPAVESAVAGSLHVLLLEDDPDQRATWSEALTRQGMSVRVATDEAELEAALALERPDVLLIDYWLGSRTAAEVGLALAASHQHSGIPRVCLTIDSGVEPRQAAMAAGYAAVLRKSVDPADLARVLRQAVANANRD